MSHRRQACTHIIKAGIQKTAQLVIQTRTDVSGDAISARNETFNIITDDYRGIGQQLERWKEDITKPMTIDISFTSHSEQNVLNVMLERWTIVYRPRPGDANYEIATMTVELQMAVLMRSLLVLLHTTPAYTLAQNIRRVKPDDTGIEYCALAQDRSSSNVFSSAVGNYKFSTVATPYGFLDLEVTYRQSCNFPLKRGSGMPSATASPEEDDTPTASRTEEELSKSGEPGRRTRSYSSMEERRPRPNSPVVIPPSASQEIVPRDFRMSSFSPPNPPTYLSHSPLTIGGMRDSTEAAVDGVGQEETPSKRQRSDSCPIRNLPQGGKSEPIITRKLSVSPFKSMSISSSTPDVSMPLMEGRQRHDFSSPPNYFGSSSVDDDGPAPLKTYDSVATHASSPSTSVAMDLPFHVGSSSGEFLMSRSLVPFSNELSDFAERCRNPPHLEMFNTKLSNLSMSIAEEISEFQSVAMAIMLRRKTQDDTPE